MGTRILLIVTGLIFLLATAYSKAEPEYMWVGDKKFDNLHSLVYTADSSYLIVNYYTSEIDKWGSSIYYHHYSIVDIETGQTEREVLNEGYIFAFTKDGRYAYSYINTRSYLDGPTGVWRIYKLSAATLTPYDSVDYQHTLLTIDGIALSSDEERIYVTSVNPHSLPETGNTILVLNAETLEILEAKELSNSGTHHIVVSNTNDLIAVENTHNYPGYGYIAVELYNAQTLELVKSFKLEKESKLRKMQFSNDGRYFAVVEYKTISIYDVQNHFELVHQIKLEDSGVTEAFYTLTFTSDNKSFYESNSKYMTTTYLRKWEIGLQKPECIYDLRLNEINEYPIVFTSDSRKFIAKPKQLQIRGKLIMVKNPCQTGTSIKEEENNNEIRTLPVLDNKILIPIEKSTINRPINWQIHNISGSQILSGIVHNVINEIQIDVSMLSNGTYFLTLQFDKEVVNYKFIKQR